jgi:hypothetical protein
MKLSVLFFYRRLFVVEKSNWKNILNLVYVGMMIVVILWTGGFCLTFIFGCKDRFSAWWDLDLESSWSCVNKFELLFACAVSDFITDVIIVILPIPSVSEDLHFAFRIEDKAD